jgi:hypothetical protein
MLTVLQYDQHVAYLYVAPRSVIVILVPICTVEDAAKHVAIN